MVKRLTKEFSEHLQRLAKIERIITEAIPPDQMKIELIQAFYNVTLDLLHEYINEEFRMYEDE